MNPSSTVAAVSPQSAPEQRPWRAEPVQPFSYPDYVAPEKAGKRILVALKHVSKLNHGFQVDANGLQISPRFLHFEMNELDEFALEQAVQTAENVGGGVEIVAVSIGPPSAEDTLRKALSKGADRAVRIWSEGLDASDPILIARMLAGVAVIEQPDLVFCGVQSSDQASGATGSALAQIIGVVCAAVVVESDWDGARSVKVTRELEGGLRQVFDIPTPAVLTIQSGANKPRFATMRMIKQAKAKPIQALIATESSDGRFRASALDGLTVPASERATMLQGTPNEIAVQILKVVGDATGISR